MNPEMALGDSHTKRGLRCWSQLTAPELSSPYNIRAKPANRLPPTTSRPYAWPKASVRWAALGLPSPLDPSPRPVKTPSVPVAVALAEADAVWVVLFSSLGLRAPQGWSSRQEDAQALSPPQSFTHWLPHSWQTKYGRVREYSDTLGCWPFPHRQPYLSVSCAKIV